MTDEELEHQIIEILWRTPGSITADQIFEQVVGELDRGRTQERIRWAVGRIVNREQELIGSTRSGFFIIRDRADAERALSYLENKTRSIRDRAEHLRNLWNRTHQDLI
jgi:hypothetical protein